jgi:hypothetical protein
MVLVDTKVYFGHVQVIRSDIEPESIEKSRDVENDPISEKKQRV